MSNEEDRSNEAEMSTESKILEELKKIREALVPPPKLPVEKKKGLQGFTNEFKDFLKSYKVMGLAVAFILGIYLGALVKSLVDNLIMPIVQIFTPGVDWEAFVLGPFRIGAFVGDLITFLIVALVIFLLVKLTKRMGIE